LTGRLAAGYFANVPHAPPTTACKICGRAVAFVEAADLSANCERIALPATSELEINIQ
jgi:hypothetical protein